MTTVLTQPDTSNRSSAIAPEALAEAFEQLFGLRKVGAAEVLLIRHAQADYGAIHQGEAPLRAPLSAKGREQAMRLAAYNERSALDAVYSSTARSAAETAAYVASVHGLPVAQVDDLRDVTYDAAALELIRDDGPSLAGDLARRFLQTPRWDVFPCSESSRTFRRRVVVAIEGIIARHPGQRVAVVCHSGVINAYLSMVLGIQRDVFFLPGHASLSTLRASGDLYAVAELNNVAHLSVALQSY